MSDEEKSKTFSIPLSVGKDKSFESPFGVTEASKILKNHAFFILIRDESHNNGY